MPQNSMFMIKWQRLCKAVLITTWEQRGKQSTEDGWMVKVIFIFATLVSKAVTDDVALEVTLLGNDKLCDQMYTL